MKNVEFKTFLPAISRQVKKCLSLEFGVVGSPGTVPFQTIFPHDIKDFTSGGYFFDFNKSVLHHSIKSDAPSVYFTPIDPSGFP